MPSQTLTTNERNGKLSYLCACECWCLVVVVGTAIKDIHNVDLKIANRKWPSLVNAVGMCIWMNMKWHAAHTVHSRLWRQMCVLFGSFYFVLSIVWLFGKCKTNIRCHRRRALPKIVANGKGVSYSMVTCRHEWIQSMESFKIQHWAPLRTCYHHYNNHTVHKCVYALWVFCKSVFGGIFIIPPWLWCNSKLIWEMCALNDAADAAASFRS